LMPTAFVLMVVMKAVEVPTQVNKWAAKETNGIVMEVLPSGSVDNTIRLVLTNALHFKVAWIENFDLSTTKDHGFLSFE